MLVALGPPGLITGVGRIDTMTPNRFNRILAWFVVISVLSALVLLVWFVPVVAAVLFVACVIYVAVSVGRDQGFWSGVKLFIKEMLFGW
jgi:hypothetical protein